MRTRPPLLAVLLTLAAASAASAVGQSAPAPVRGIQLTVGVQEALSRVEQHWLLWNSAFLQSNREEAEGAIEDLLATLEELGMKRLPDLSLGILIRAVEAAREGDVERAEWALKMAERLDGSLPEVAFARSRVAMIRGAYPRAMVQQILGYTALARVSLKRVVWLHNVGLWLLLVLIVTASLFVAVQMVVKGGFLMRDLTGLLARFVPTFAAYILAVVLVGWPFLLPRGWILLVIYWAALLWPYGSRSERWVLGALFVLLGITPVLVVVQEHGLELSSSRSARAIDSVVEGSLSSTLFGDLGELRSTLPESAAVSHLIADLHVGLGQDQLARPRYLSLIEEEPDNTGAMINLGSYHYNRREYFKAIEQFKRATESDPQRIEALYDLSQAYRALLEFGNADQYMEQARALDPDLVSDWITRSVNVLTTSDGVHRRDEIRRELAVVWDAGREQPVTALLARGGSLPVAFGGMALGLVLIVLHGGAATSRPLRRQETFVDRWIRILVPGYAAAERGAGLSGLISVGVPVAALLLPLGGVIGYRVPWGYDPGTVIPWLVTGIVLVVYAVLRIRSV